MVVALKAEHRLQDLLAAASLARSTFIYHQARLQDTNRHGRLKESITPVFHDAHGRYGYRRIHHVLATGTRWHRRPS